MPFKWSLILRILKGTRPLLYKTYDFYRETLLNQNRPVPCHRVHYVADLGRQQW